MALGNVREERQYPRTALDLHLDFFHLHKGLKLRHDGTVLRITKNLTSQKWIKKHFMAC